MSKDEILLETSNNLKDIGKNEEELAMLCVALHEKKKEKMKKEKLEELENYLNNQAKLYEQDASNYMNRIEDIKKDFLTSLDYIFYYYDELLVHVYKKLTEERCKQKVDVSNLVTLHEKITKEDISEEEKQILQLKINACANRKLNYTYIIDELYERQKWCIYQLESDVSEIFKISSNGLRLYKNTLFSKVKDWFVNKFYGNKKYTKFLNEYKSNLKDISSTIKRKKIEVASIAVAIENQIADAERQMSEIYNSMLQVA